MEKEFIPYEQALALKELGFDEPCLASYETAFGKGIDFELGYIIDGPKNYVLAPLYQQAFRWFRKKYGLFHSITEYNKDGSLIIEISKDRVEIFRKMTNFGFTEYRRAEIECLKKLIEIVKNK